MMIRSIDGESSIASPASALPGDLPNSAPVQSVPLDCVRETSFCDDHFVIGRQFGRLYFDWVVY
jgi:hypothetical protein